MKYILSLLTLIPFLALSQCDLEIYDFHPETLETTIIVHNGYGCNPNDPTDDVITKFILGITSNELQADEVDCGLLQQNFKLIMLHVVLPITILDGFYKTISQISHFGITKMLTWAQMVF